MDVIMPQLGETVAEGLITTWYKKPGDSVAADEPLFEVETDKVTTEIPAPTPGVVREILIEAGTTVKVGTRLAVISTASEAQGAQAVATRSSGAALLAAAARPGALTQSAATTQPTDQLGSARSDSRFPRNRGRKLSPVVRRLLTESGLAAESIQGSGRDGRITREDMLKRISGKASGEPLAQTQAQPQRQSPAQPQRQSPALSSAASPDDRIVPLNKIRRATAAHMVRSIATSVHTLQAVEVDFQNVERVRTAKGADWKSNEGFALTYLPFVCAATCEAIAEFPYINATFSNDSLIVHRRVNLGIAVDLGFDGLMVPVLRDANHKNLRGLARDTYSLVKKARSNTLTADEVSGGTYTLSNSGSFGTLITAPIINQPQVAILSLDGVHKKPAVIEGPDGDAIAIRPIGVLAQSFDHRAFDGAYSAGFLRRLKQILETRNWLTELN
jgi:2-oxoglutarate dehydrogenase E2 component (dihydrolipoamide succinyltransferase)